MVQPDGLISRRASRPSPDESNRDALLADPPNDDHGGRALGRAVVVLAAVGLLAAPWSGAPRVALAAEPEPAVAPAAQGREEGIEFFEQSSPAVGPALLGMSFRQRAEREFAARFQGGRAGRRRHRAGGRAGQAGRKPAGRRGQLWPDISDAAQVATAGRRGGRADPLGRAGRPLARRSDRRPSIARKKFDLAEQARGALGLAADRFARCRRR